jgi:hypothetical protein
MAGELSLPRRKLLMALKQRQSRQVQPVSSCLIVFQFIDFISSSFIFCCRLSGCVATSSLAVLKYCRIPSGQQTRNCAQIRIWPLAVSGVSSADIFAGND